MRTRTSLTRTAAAVALLAMLATPMAALADAKTTPMAVVMSCTGPVQVVRASGETTDAAFGTQLFAGDEIRTGKDATAEVMFEAGNALQMGADSKIQIKPNKRTATAATAPKKEKQFKVVHNFLKLKDAQGTSSLSRLRSGDANNEIVPVTPCGTKTMTSTPTFQWRIADPSTELKLTVYEGTKGAVWEHDVTGVTAVVYPADAPALEPGKSYSWTLESADPLQVPPLRIPAVFFEVLSSEEVTMLNEALDAVSANDFSSDATYRLVRASILFDQGLVDDAIAETETALAEDADNTALQSILAQLYLEAGRTVDAMAAFSKLRQ